MRKRQIAVLLIAGLIGMGTVQGESTISVVVPAKKPSRPATFNWEFRSANGGKARVGQFACGSYWVAPAKGDDGVTLRSLTGSSEWEDLLSCDADPVIESMGLLSSKKTYGNYNADENILPKLPLTFRPAKDSCVSLVAAVQRDEAATSKGGTKAIVGNVADAYCVVTVLPRAPRDGGHNMIRPNITGDHKEFLTWNDFDLSRLPKHSFLEGKNAGGWQSVSRKWRHTTEIFGISAEAKKKKTYGNYFCKFSEGGRAFRACLSTHDYASGMASSFNSDLLAMFASSNNLEEMKPALAAMISFGLDIYHTRYNYGDSKRKRWSSGAGQSTGAFMPAAFAASLLKDESKAHHLRMAAITNHGKDPAESAPQELTQIKRGVTGVLLWGDGHRSYGYDAKGMSGNDWRYWADFSGSKCYDGYVGKKKPNPSRGKKTAADPYGYIDGPANKPGSAYMSVTGGCYRSFAAIMILMPAVRSVVNTDDPIEYTDRLTRHGLWTWPDPVAAPVACDQDSASLWYKIKGCQEWGKTWGVRPDDSRYAIENGKGRFKSLHGTRKNSKWGYESGQALRHWGKIIALYDGPRFEDNAVPLGVTVTPEILFATGANPHAYLFCATPEAKVYYTTDGSKPNPRSRVYDGNPIAVEPKTVVKAVAVGKGKKPSAMRSKTLPKPLGK